jgi:hypothetical protein
LASWGQIRKNCQEKRLQTKVTAQQTKPLIGLNYLE